MYGFIARNKQGRAGIVLGWKYDHANGGAPVKFRGIGVNGGSWTSREVPELIARSINEYAKNKARLKNSRQKDD